MCSRTHATQCASALLPWLPKPINDRSATLVNLATTANTNSSAASMCVLTRLFFCALTAPIQVLAVNYYVFSAISAGGSVTSMLETCTAATFSTAGWVLQRVVSVTQPIQLGAETSVSSLPPGAAVNDATFALALIATVQVLTCVDPVCSTLSSELTHLLSTLCSFICFNCGAICSFLYSSRCYDLD